MASNTVEIKLTELDIVQNVLRKQNKEIEKLNNKIDKTIEYIENNCVLNKGDLFKERVDIDATKYEKILSILRGEDNE